MPTMEIHHSTLESFFFDEIERAKERGGQTLSAEAEAYVVGLLARFARRTAVAGRRSEPLALDYLRARTQTGAAGVKALRGVGDRALYISGVAPRSLSRTPVDVRYVRGIGEAAYREVVDRAQGHGHGRSGGALAVLGELAEDFEEVAEVIAEIVDLEAQVPTRDLLGIYERWRRDGDPRDRRRLMQAGVLLDTHGPDQVQ